MTITDCLVLHVDSNSGAQMFVIYDCKTGLYEIRGKQNCTKLNYSRDIHPYAFSCAKVKYIIQFIDILFCDDKLNDNDNENKTITLYNYDELPDVSENITFDFLLNHTCSSRELFFKSNIKLFKNKCKKLLKMMKHIYNEY